MKKGLVLTPADFQGVDWLALMSQLGLNTLGLHSGGGASHNVLQELSSYASSEFRAQALARDIEIEYENHCATLLLPREQFALHPDFFPQNILSQTRTLEGNWCITNQALQKYIGERALQISKIIPSSTKRNYFWGADNNKSWCHCDRCSKYSRSEQSLLSANALASALAPLRQKVAYLFYLNMLEIPEHVQPAPGVFLEFAPIDRCYRHPINDPDCAQNRICWNALKRLVTLFNPQEVQVLEYWLDASLYSRWKKPVVKPLFNKEIFKRDLEAYRSLGIQDFTTFAVYMDGEYFKKYGTQDLQDYASILNQ